MLDDVKIPEFNSLPKEAREELQKYFKQQKEALVFELLNIIEMIRSDKK